MPDALLYNLSVLDALKGSVEVVYRRQDTDEEHHSLLL
jgi:hypothetical protein